MSASVINDQQRLAIVERIASHTVGIAAAKNTAVGTGTLVASNGKCFVVTAEHVIKGADVQSLRFWVRPPAPIVEKPARDLTRKEIGRLTEGEIFPIEGISSAAEADIAAIQVASSFKPPAPNGFYDLSRSKQFAIWPSDELDGLSLIYFGFPVANSLSLGQVGDRAYHFVGCAHGAAHYERGLNAEAWKDLPSSYFPEKDFLLKYNLSKEGIDPHGFSGCGVWVASVNPDNQVWSSEPLMIGMIHTYFRRKAILAATKVSTFLHVGR